MKRFTGLILVPILSFAYAGVHAAESSAYYGKEDCRIAPLDPSPAFGRIEWSGACKDGFAEGAGVLTWSSWTEGRRKLEGTLVRGEVSGEATLTVSDVSVGVPYTYKGPLKRGYAHGSGYIKFVTGDEYEGDINMDKRDGKGIALFAGGSLYEGDWKADRIEGHGRMRFASGGSYEGQWKDSAMNGQGKIVYAGSGRTYEGLFEDDRPAGTKPRLGEAPKVMHLASDRRARHLNRVGDSPVAGLLPPDLPWEKLTPAQQDAVRSWYPALEDGDEPPYPLTGIADTYRVTMAVREAMREEIKGTVIVRILVGTDGLAKSVSIVGKPPAKLAQYMVQAAMVLKFKPAFCHGAPCEMLHLTNYWFE
jgi:hypothetical protein